MFAPAYADTDAAMPIVHDGRVKPIDSFARQALKSIYGRESYEGQSASEWLNTLMQNPASRLNAPYFHIKNASLKQKLSLDADTHYISAAAIASVLNTDEINALIGAQDTRTLNMNEQALLALYDRTVLFGAILTGQAYTAPHPITPAIKSRAHAEYIYNLTRPRMWVALLYILSAMLGIAALYKRAHSRLSYLAPFSILTFGVCLHIFAFIWRIYILQRAPIATLYETLLFVSLIVAGAGIGAAFISRKRSVGIMSALMGAGLLVIAPFTVSGGDSLAPVAAVLNTNFWLGIHVTCITAGYAACVITALMAHGALWSQRSVATRHCLIASMIALFLTATGTLLGGIWADQSWGRFWGWDPKENGALFIVLWITWLHHGRLGKLMGDRWFLAGLAFLNVIVALAWFGVNLLGVGLHSYGFTSGLAGGLAAFCIAEVALITFIMMRGRYDVA